jgi:hypothetical protein
MLHRRGSCGPPPPLSLENLMDETRLKQLRTYISNFIKNGHEMSDFRCTDCGVGITNGEETYIITPDLPAISVLCKSCANQAIEL